jgi:putative DNA primase/helicase
MGETFDFQSKLKEIRNRLGSDQNAAKVDLTTLVDVAPEPIEWLWPGRIARRKLTIIAGEPGLGKSQLGLDVIARLTTGNVWPDTGRAPAGDAIILSAEDAIADTVRPRIEAADADLEHVHMVRSVLRRDENNQVHETMFSLQTDLDALGEAIAQIGISVSLVMIDPITAYLGDRIDTHKTGAVRSVLAAVDQFAHKHNVAVLGISHPPKVVPSGKAMHAVSGSLAFVAAARIVLLAIEDSSSSGRNLLLPVKNNLGRPAVGLAYRLAQRIVSCDIVISHVAWEQGEVALTANEALADASDSIKRHSALRDAEDFLNELLAAGPVLVKSIEEAAKAEGISAATLRRARERLEIITEKQDYSGPWQWRLPEDAKARRT